MIRPVPVEAIRKLADAGKRAGFSFEDLVALPDSGITGRNWRT